MTDQVLLDGADGMPPQSPDDIVRTRPTGVERDRGSYPDAVAIRPADRGE